MRDELVAMVDRALSSVSKDALVGVRQLELELDWLMARAVAQARRDGYDWARVGRLLGRSRQAVRKRFGTLVPDAPPSAKRRALLDQHRRQVAQDVAEARRRLAAEADDVVAW